MSTRDKLLRALARPVGSRFSGEWLARELGVTRAMVWKHLKALKDLGLPVRSDGRNGYQVLGSIDPSLFEWRPSGTLARWLKPHYFWDIRSTQNQAKAEAEAGLPEGHLWIAEHQRGGRGRLGRAWDSGYGGLWFSVLLRPCVPAAQAPSVTLVAALTMAQAIRQCCGVKAQLKWPNDVVVRHQGKWRKLAGILTEMSAEVSRTHWVVMGVGLNVSNRLPRELKDVGIALHDLTRIPLARGRLLNTFFEMFRPMYSQWMTSGFEPFRKDYWRLHRDPSKSLRLKTVQGMVAGRARGVDGSGALIIESRREVLHLLEGEIDT